jgi:hypothetical protein
MDNSTLSLRVSATEPELDVSIHLNDVNIFQGKPSVDPVIVNHKFVDTDQAYTLTITMSGKTIDHTKVDEFGNIIGTSVH